MECICDTCQNLKTVAGEAEGEILSTCEYGFPKAECETCEADGCDAVCAHYSPAEEAPVYRARCAGCGKELTVTEPPDDTPLYCMDCYLKREG